MAGMDFSDKHVVVTGTLDTSSVRASVGHV
jgi:hypothetical protein